MGDRLRAVIFDLGNTLIYFDGAWPEVMAQADRQLLAYLRSAGLVLDEAGFLELFRARLDEYYEERESEFIEHTTAYVLGNVLAELGHGEVSEALLEPALESLYAVSQAHWKREPDTLPTLRTLQEQGFPLGLISNASNDADVQVLVDNAKIRPYFDFVLTSAAVGVRKPNPLIFKIALDKWGASPNQVAMVGDTLGADILGARNAGLFSIWLTRRADTPANRDHLDTIQPDAKIETLSELLPLIAAL
jgi:putative hydrolase of the HAD superfamily